MKKRIFFFLSILSVICLASQVSGIEYFIVAEIGEPFFNDSYVLPLSVPSDIAHARDLIEYGPGIGQAIVVAGIFGWDGWNRDYQQPGAPAWSWSVAFLEFADFTAEIFDGWPTAVEEGIFMEGTIGFWSYTVVAELEDWESWSCDLDIDGNVDVADLSTFSSQWQRIDCEYPYWCQGADLNGDGNVNLEDFMIFVRGWLWHK
jgi:hypothetical protein